MRRTAALYISVLCVTCFGAASSVAQEYGSISGTVTDGNGVAVSHAKVTADYVCSAACVKKMALDQTVTDDKGRYEFKRLSYGRYALSAEKPEDNYPPLYLSFYSDEKNPEVELSETHRSVALGITLTKKAGVLVGTVTDADTGIPIDAGVEFRSTTDPRRFLSGSGLTNSRFRVLVPPDTPVLMKVSKEGYDNWFFTHDGVNAPLQLGPSEILTMEIKLKRASSERSSSR